MEELLDSLRHINSPNLHPIYEMDATVLIFSDKNIKVQGS